MNYTELNDNELIYMINESNESAYNCLYNKYKNVIYKIALKYNYRAKKCGLEINDLMLEGYMAFDTALKKYKDNDSNSKFSNFLYKCIEYSIQNLIRNNTLKRDIILNKATNNVINEIEINNIKDNKNNMPEKKLIADLNYETTYNKIFEKLVGIERQVFKLKAQNYSTKEIAILIGKNVKAVNNALERIRKKKKLLNID